MSLDVFLIIEVILSSVNRNFLPLISIILFIIEINGDSTAHLTYTNP